VENKNRVSNSSAKTPVISNEISVLNNPFTNYIEIKFTKMPTGRGTLQLTDLSGRVIATSEFNTSSQQVIRFNVKNKVLNSGLYLLTVETANKKFEFKIVHQ
jgi:hypothetical protein